MRADLAGGVVGTAPWRDALFRLRDGLLASPRFQRWASGFLLTRGIARRRARDLFDLCAGFVYSQVLLACVQLRVFDILAEGPQTLAALSARLSLPIPATARLIEAAVSLRLVARRGRDRFGLGQLGAAMVGNAGIAAMVAHHAALYADLQDPVALLRGQVPATALSAYWAYAGRASPAAASPDQVADYTALMSASQPMIAAEIVDAYDFGQHACLLDVGGGDGTFLAAVAPRAPGLRMMLFDLPSVAARARVRFARAGIEGRATAIGGDFTANPLPPGADIISLVRVIHDHDDAPAIAILRAARRAVAPGGTILLSEPMADTQGAEPIGAAYFGFYLLAMGSGRARSAQELEAMLRLVGFEDVRSHATRNPMLTRVLTARAPRTIASVNPD